jgi:hypothetical protein
MRSARVGLLVCILFLAIPSQGKQASQNSSTTQLASDPQAIAVVQAAITALGGATAIGLAQSWTFQAQTQGPHSNGNVDYVISTDTDTGKITRPNGTTRPAPKIHSHFLPALVGAILLKESRDPQFSMQYAGLSTQDSKPVTTVVFTVDQTRIPAQIWTFDAANLPVRIDFRLSAEIGARQSFPLLVALSDYRLISGVLFPFQILTYWPGKPPEVVTLQSVSVNATAPVSEFNGASGDLR